MEKGKNAIKQAEELGQLIFIPLLWITFVWESKDLGFIVSSTILAIILFAPLFGLVSALIYLYVTRVGNPPHHMDGEEIAKLQFYSKYTPYLFLIGIVIGLPFILGFQIFVVLSAVWLNLITYPSLLAQYTGFSLSIMLTWTYKAIAINFFSMNGVYVFDTP